MYIHIFKLMEENILRNYKKSWFIYPPDVYRKSAAKTKYFEAEIISSGETVFTFEVYNQVYGWKTLKGKFWHFRKTICIFMENISLISCLFWDHP